jgi:outer membrane immunogenic protein
MRTLSLAAAAASLLAAPAFAQSVSAPAIYGNAGYTAFDGQDAQLGAVTGRLGAKLHPNFGVEAEGSLGVKKDDIQVSVGGSGKYELKHDLAAYAVGAVPISDNLELFARLGYGTTKIEASPAGVTPVQDGSSVNYGVGANYLFDGVNGVRADWTRRDFTHDNAGEADTWSVAYVRRF